MSFLGKQFKRTRMEGVEELMDTLKVDEKLRALATKGGSSVTTYVKNDDGTYSHLVQYGEKATDNKFTLGEEFDFTRPDGLVVKSRYELEGDTLTQTVTDPAAGGGADVTFTRVFSDDSMTLTISANGQDAKVYYEIV